jgi:hypothetical protein
MNDQSQILIDKYTYNNTKVRASSKQNFEYKYGNYKMFFEDMD